MRRTRWIGTLLALLALLPAAQASGLLRRTSDLDAFNRRLHGHVDDYTHNHGADHRIWSAALSQKRDLYVYLPPGYDPHQQYPIVLFLHGFTQDETTFLREGVPLF